MTNINPENKSKKYRKPIISAISSFVVSYAVFYFTQTSECKKCSECDIIKNRRETLLAKSQKLVATRAILTSNDVYDSINRIKIDKEAIRISYRLDEINYIINELNKN